MSQTFAPVPFLCLETKRLRLRPANPKDAEAVLAVFSDPKVTQFHDLDTLVHLDATQVYR